MGRRGEFKWRASPRGTPFGPAEGGTQQQSSRFNKAEQYNQQERGCEDPCRKDALWNRLHRVIGIQIAVVQVREKMVRGILFDHRDHMMRGGIRG